MYLSIIIPAKNEEKNIKNTVEDVFKYLTDKNFSYEIIVVENNSKDKTVEMVNSLLSTIHTLSLLHLVIETIKPSKGYAVKMGMLKAQGDYKLIMDADNATNIRELEKLMPYFDHGYDVVIGSIALKGSNVASGSEPVWRIIFGKMGNLFIQIMAVPGIFDTQRGFKIFSKKSADEIFYQTKISGWGWDIEALALARKYRYKIKEVPISWKNDMSNSKIGLRAYFQVLLETVKIRWNLLTGKYNDK